MNLIKPKKLNKGDTIGILPLSGAVESKTNILRAKKYFENKGFKVVLSENIFDNHRYLAGTDEKKVEELHKFFANPKISMILCARGGYGAIRLLDKIDFNLIKNNPKIFAGYSDVSAL
ncbi:MAG: LD-carboxypeptidase, partial [bacterium]